MISSGMKRGLAASAVSALAVAGLPLLASSASANSMAEQATAADAVVLYTPDTVASIKNDGVNTTVHLVANGGADVIQVHFEYLDGATWKNIATVSRTNGIFSTEWAPPVSVYNLPVQIRATALDKINVEGNADTNTALVTANQEAIDIANAPGSNVGVFQQPYAATNDKLLGAVHGTTSDVAANPSITVSSPSGTGSAMSEDYASEVANGDVTRSWSAPVDFTGYSFDADATNGTVDQALVIATDQSNDGESVNLYKQKITTVTATAAKTTVQGNGTTSVDVKVTDQNGAPIVGAEVFQDDNGDNAGDAAAKYTDSRGIATFSGIDGSTTGKTHYFFVNTTGNVAYENGIDYKRSVTVTAYTPAASTLTPSSADGAAFDDDEYADGDITITVKDQNGNAVPAGTAVTYYWSVDPFTAQTGYPKDLAEQTGTTDADGKVTAIFPVGQPSGTYTLHSYINQDGTPGQDAGDLGGTPLTVKAGQADIVWADGSVAQAASNSTETFEGSLELEDGTGLAGRNIAINWTPTGDAVVAAQSAQPAGTTRTGNTSATTATDKDGSFGVALADPPATAPATPANEKGGTLTASTANTPKIGNAGDSSSLTVDFLKSVAPASAADIVVDVDNLFTYQTPGRPADLDITVKNADGDTLTDFPITVSVNHGFLSPNAEVQTDLTPDPAPAEGGLFGEWKDSGTSKELTTDDTGETGTVVAIEKDAAFDTSDEVITTVTIKAGDVTKTVPVTFTTDIDPVNPGEVMVERAAASDQTVTVLPKAPTAESVYYNVFATDQFGNLIPGQTVDLTDTLGHAYMNGSDNNTSVASQLKSDSPVLELDSNVAGDQAVTGSWTADTRTWTDGDPVAPGFQTQLKYTADGKTVKDTGETVNWYTIDFAKSTYSMTHDTADSVKVGTTVLETYKAVDQNGEPIRNVTVKFFRSGPDSYQDGDFNSAAVTNEAGEASYVFSGAKAGTATVQGLITDYSPLGGDQIVSESRATDQVTFVGDVLVSPEVDLRGHDNGAKADKLKAHAIPAAAGAVVKLFKVTKSGALKLVGTGTLNQYGNHKFKVADENGNKKTAYVAKVAKTNKTTKGEDRKSVR